MEKINLLVVLLQHDICFRAQTFWYRNFYDKTEFYMTLFSNSNVISPIWEK